MLQVVPVKVGEDDAGEGDIAAAKHLDACLGGILDELGDAPRNRVHERGAKHEEGVVQDRANHHQREGAESGLLTSTKGRLLLALFGLDADRADHQKRPEEQNRVIRHPMFAKPLPDKNGDNQDVERKGPPTPTFHHTVDMTAQQRTHDNGPHGFKYEFYKVGHQIPLRHENHAEGDRDEREEIRGDACVVSVRHRG